MRPAALASVLPLLAALSLPADAETAPASDADAFFEKATENGLFELAIARLAIARSKDSDVMRLGNHVVQVFNGANAAIAGAAGDREPPRALNAADQSQFDSLQGTGDAAFTATYLHLQRQSLDAATALYRAYASSGSEGLLRDTAARYVDDLARLSDALAAIEKAGTAPSGNRN